MKKLVLLICIIFINLFFIGCNQFIDYSNENILEMVKKFMTDNKKKSIEREKNSRKIHAGKGVGVDGRWVL